MQLHLNIVVGDEISLKSLQHYDDILHQQIYPPVDRNQVREIVICSSERIQVIGMDGKVVEEIES